MIGLLLALALVVGCPGGAAVERAQAVAAAICIEPRAAIAARVVCSRQRPGQAESLVARMTPTVRPRALDPRRGGLPQPRAPDFATASLRVG